MSIYLSVVIPAYNEADRIEPTLRSVHAYLSQQPYTYEIIVVSDGSTDITVATTGALKSDITRLRVIDNTVNRGKGAVVKQGMLEAKGEIRLFMDADNATTIDHIGHFFRWFEKGYDIVIGSRRVNGARIDVHQPWIKETLGRCGNIWIRLLTVRGIHDTQAGFKAFTAEAAKTVFSRLTESGWGFDIEALAIARVHTLLIKEAPIVWRDDARSKVKPIDYLVTLLKPLRIRLNVWRAKYE